MGIVIFDSSFPIACFKTDQRLMSPCGAAFAGSLSLSKFVFFILQPVAKLLKEKIKFSY
jgi:hypothetical protein